MHLEGRAATWYHHVMCQHKDIIWPQFINLVSVRLEEIKEVKLIGEFNKLKQMGSYDEYVDKFEELRTCLIPLSCKEL